MKLFYDKLYLPLTSLWKQTLNQPFEKEHYIFALLPEFASDDKM